MGAILTPRQQRYFAACRSSVRDLVDKLPEAPINLELRPDLPNRCGIASATIATSVSHSIEAARGDEGS